MPYIFLFPVFSRKDHPMDQQEFLSQLEARIAKFDLLCHPFYQAWSQGKLTAADLREYAADYYHHVAAFPSYLSAFHSRLQDGAMRKAVAENCADEEGIGSPDGRSHAELWMDFAAGFGGSDVQGRRPVKEMLALIENFRRIAREGSSAEALATFYAYESQVPRVAKEKARGLKQMYGADAKTCRYFTLHTTADVRHSQTWKELLSKEVADDASASRALDAAESAAKALWTALDGIERERLARAA
jgi:pyrroloquinoline-quinone synthase